MTLQSPVPTASLQELAEIEGDRDRMTMLTQQLEELEERADQLDKQRTKGLSAIRFLPYLVEMPLCVYVREFTL